MVFYLKYRPQNIDDLDSKQVREKLFSVLSANVSHAFLFTGPKGLGKTSTARIIAKAINCTGRAINKEQRTKNKEQKGKSVFSSEPLVQGSEAVEPCNECDQCKSITSGINMDVIEIDAASNRGIDEIRDLREKIWLAPLKAKKKVYIIDEVHMLTTEAFNALLKTLEEPPVHAMFILCTTEPQKVPATILSRCFHIQFSLATEDEIVRSLARIVKGEKLDADNEVLYAIARMADGGFRDATKILEEVSILANNEKITKELFEKLYKSANVFLHTVGLLAALKAKNAKSSLEIIRTLVSEGVDLRFFIAQVLNDLHARLLKKFGVSLEKHSFLKDESMIDFEVDEITVLVNLFSRAYQEMKAAVLPQLPLELAVVEYATGDKKINTGRVIAGNDSQDKVGEVTISGLRKQVGDKFKMKALYGEPDKGDVTRDGVKVAEKSIELMNVPANGEVTKEWMAAFWDGIISGMKQYNHTFAGVLRSCAIRSFDNLPAGRQGKRLVIGTRYEFHKERLDDKKARLALMKVCKMLTGNEVEIEVELDKK